MLGSGMVGASKTWVSGRWIPIRRTLGNYRVRIRVVGETGAKGAIVLSSYWGYRRRDLRENTGRGSRRRVCGCRRGRGTNGTVCHCGGVVWYVL